jgi:hypothetical protein
MIRKLLSIAAILASAFLPVAVNAQSFNQRAVVSVAALGDNILIPAVTGKMIYVYGLDITYPASNTIQFKCGSVLQTGVMTVTTYSKNITASGSAYFACAAGTAFIGTIGTAAQLSGIIWYAQQ